MLEKSIQDINQIYQQNLLTLLREAQHIHQQNFTDDIELCHLISVKTGGCPEDCGYCSQSVKYKTKIKLNPLLSITAIEPEIIQAKKHGVKRICLGAAYKAPTASALKQACQYIQTIKKHNLEACITFGSLTLEQAKQLKLAGLDYYNHNIDTSPEYYDKIISTRTFSDRVDTIKHIGDAGIKVCCGGILGIGESQTDRISFIHALTKLPYTPQSIPINLLVKIPGTPLANTKALDKLELLRTIATVRILFPQTRIRLSAGRLTLSELEQTACFMAGANSIFYGEQLLTTPNATKNADQRLLSKLRITPDAVVE